MKEETERRMSPSCWRKFQNMTNIAKTNGINPSNEAAPGYNGLKSKMIEESNEFAGSVFGGIWQPPDLTTHTHIQVFLGKRDLSRRYFRFSTRRKSIFDLVKMVSFGVVPNTWSKTSFPKENDENCNVIRGCFTTSIECLNGENIKPTTERTQCFHVSQLPKRAIIDRVNTSI